MVKSRKQSGLAVSFPVGVAIGAGVSMAITIILASIMAWMMGREIISGGGIGIASATILVTSAIAGSIAASGKIKHRRLLACMTSGGVYYMLLLCCTALFFGGQYQGMGVTALTVIGGSAAAAIIELRGEGKSHGKHSWKKVSR